MISPTILGPTGLTIGRPSTYNQQIKRPLERELVYFFYFLTVRRDGILAPFSLDGDSYPDYNDFVNGNSFPLTNDFFIFNEGFVAGEVNGSITRVNNQLTTEWQYNNREFIPDDLLIESRYIEGRIEMWSRALDRDSNIPASRHIIYASDLSPTVGSVVGNFTFSGGNPANRSRSGSLQSNGFYKAEFDVALPYSYAFSNGNYYFKAIVNPYSVPNSATYITPV